MSDKEEFLSTQDFGTLRDLRTKAAFIVAKAEKAILESRVAELEYKSALLNAYLKYGLATTDAIDMDDQGKIIRAEVQTPAPSEQTKE